MTNTDKDPFIVKATAMTLVIMGALLICGIFIQHHNATRPTTHMTCKTVKANTPEGDWTCVIWDTERPTDADFKKYAKGE